MNKTPSTLSKTVQWSSVLLATLLLYLFGCEAKDDDGSFDDSDSNRVGEETDNQAGATANGSDRPISDPGGALSGIDSMEIGRGDAVVEDNENASGGQGETNTGGSVALDTTEAGSGGTQPIVDSGIDTVLLDYPDASVDDAAIADSEIGDGDANAIDGDEAGLPAPPYAVGTVRIEIESNERRIMPVQLWYPAVESARAEAEQGHPTEQFEPVGEKRDQLAAWLANSPDECTNKVMHAALAPEVLSLNEPFPAVVVSHCMPCVRFAYFTVAEHLASLGFVVAAPDHKDTIYDPAMSLDIEATFQGRANDIKSVIDMLLDPQSRSLIDGLRGKIDPERLGMFGHSGGSITTGRVLGTDSRVKAGVMVAGPIDTEPLLGINLFPGTDGIKQPGLFIVATEDNPLFTDGLEANYEAFPNPAWLVRLKDASHWSFIDITYINENPYYAAGCGTGPGRDGLFETVTYLDADLARTITTKYTAAFFNARFNGDSDAEAYLKTADPSEVVTVKHHP